MAKITLIIIFLFFSVFSFALNPIQELLDKNQLEEAQDLLIEQYKQTNNKFEKLNIQFVLAQISTEQKKYDEAIAIYNKILSEDPSLTRAHIEIAQLYIIQNKDKQAQYHLRLALADKNLSQENENYIKNLLEYIRKRRAYQFYISLGVAPDSNVNTMSGSHIQCFTYMGLPFCQELDEIQADISLQGVGVFSYLYKFNDKLGLKTNFIVNTTDYQNNKYSFWGLGGEFGPQYTGETYKLFLGLSYQQEWNDESRYNRTNSIFTDLSLSINNKMFLSSRIFLSDVIFNKSEYKDYNSINSGINLRINYALSKKSYLSLVSAFTYENTKEKTNSNIQQYYAIGYGREMFWGFDVYVEPNIMLKDFRKSRLFISSHHTLERQKRDDITYGIYISLANKYFKFWDIMPRLNFIYNERRSNIYNYDYDRKRIELALSKNF